MSFRKPLSASPWSKKENSAAISIPNITTIEGAHIEEEESDFDDSGDEDYSGGDEDDANLFAENVIYGLDDVFIVDDDIKLAIDKEIDEENNRDIL